MSESPEFFLISRKDQSFSAPQNNGREKERKKMRAARLGSWLHGTGPWGLVLIVQAAPSFLFEGTRPGAPGLAGLPASINACMLSHGEPHRYREIYLPIYLSTSLPTSTGGRGMCVHLSDLGAFVLRKADSSL